jgi:hypothetical protein
MTSGTRQLSSWGVDLIRCLTSTADGGSPRSEKPGEGPAEAREARRAIQQLNEMMRALASFSEILT